MQLQAKIRPIYLVELGNILRQRKQQQFKVLLHPLGSVEHNKAARKVQILTEARDYVKDLISPYVCVESSFPLSAECTT